MTSEEVPPEDRARAEQAASSVIGQLLAGQVYPQGPPLVTRRPHAGLSIFFDPDPSALTPGRRLGLAMPSHSPE